MCSYACLVLIYTVFLQNTNDYVNQRNFALKFGSEVSKELFTLLEASMTDSTALLLEAIQSPTTEPCSLGFEAVAFTPLQRMEAKVLFLHTLYKGYLTHYT